MTRSYPSSWAAKKNAVSSTTGWIWLLELNVDGVNALRIACNYDAVVTFNGYTWYPYEVEIGEQRDDQDGRINEVDIHLCNVGLLAMPYAELGQVFNNYAKLIIVHEDTLGDATAKMETRVVVDAISGDAEKCILTCSLETPLKAQFPAERFFRTRCRFLPEYGSATGRCGYDKTLSGALATCDGSLDGANGCRAHGANESTYGRPVNHPKRFGGFPGIPAGPLQV